MATWLCLGAQTGPLSVADQRPNILVILADDLGWTDVAGRHLGPYTSDFYETSHLDRLAAGGMRFTQAYSAAPVCTPTRASLLAGRYPAWLNLTDIPWNHHNAKLRPPQLSQALPLAELTVVDRLQEAGYATLHVGKWHLGGSDDMPLEQGFDASFVNTEVPIQGSWDKHRAKGLTDTAIQFIQTNRDRPFHLLRPPATTPAADHQARPEGLSTWPRSRVCITATPPTPGWSSSSTSRSGR